MNVLRPRYDCIPNELKARNQWVCWLLKKVEQTEWHTTKETVHQSADLPDDGHECQHDRADHLGGF